MLVLVFTCSLFTHCKSVEFTFLGFLNRKYSMDSRKMQDNTIEKANIDLLKDTKSALSGIVTDTFNNPIIGAEIYITKGNQILYKTKSDSNGKYSIPNLKTDIYILYLIPADPMKYQNTKVEIKPGIYLSPINFKLKNSEL